MPKNIITCCDGTGNEYGQHNTNVVKLYEAIVRDANQIAFYDPGVGTFSILGRELGRRVGIVLGKAFGAGVQQNIEDAYRYLMDRYEPEDKVFLFGFSRGAFTVRALAGMLNRCGLLEKGSVNLVPYASRIYNNRARHAVAPDFKQTYCHECHPHFIGVWDTVGSMGWFWGRKFFDATLHEDVRYAYQAVSIDEQRRKFPPSLWHEPVGQERIEQVWFAGVHSDVGAKKKRLGGNARRGWPSLLLAVDVGFYLHVALLHDSTAARVGALFQLLVQDTTAQDFGLPSSAIRLRM